MTARLSTDTVWSQMSSDLRRFIRRRVSDDHVADDLLQETFVRIHRNIDTLNNADRLAAWVYQIARNVIHGHYRQGSGNALPLVNAVPFEEDGKSALCSRVEEWLDEMVRQLPAKYREAVQLSEIDGLTQREVADRLGLSLSGAKSRIQRGRATLKEVLDGCCFLHFDRRGNLMDLDPKPDRKVCLDCDDWVDPSLSRL